MNNPSIAAQVIISIVPIAGIAAGLTVIILYLIFSHKQKVLMIQKGILPSRNFDYKVFSLFSGVVLTGVGLSLSIFFVMHDGIGYGLLSGLIPFSVGAGLVLFYYIAGKQNS